MSRNLSVTRLFVINSIPSDDREWGIDGKDVISGLREIRRKCPYLWQVHGDAITEAVRAVDDDLDLRLDKAS